MPQLLQTLIGICMFKAKPQDLPSSNQWLILCITLIIGSSLLINRGENNTHEITFSILQVITFIAIVFTLLKLKNISQRWTQTTTALLGCNFLLQLAIMPFADHLQSLDPNRMVITPQIMFVFAISLWGLCVAAHIFKHALGTTFMKGFFWGLGLQILTLMVTLSILGLPTEAAA